MKEYGQFELSPSYVVMGFFSCCGKNLVSVNPNYGRLHMAGSLALFLGHPLLISVRNVLRQVSLCPIINFKLKIVILSVTHV